MSILSEVTQLVDGVDVVSAKDIMDTQETAISAIKKADEALDKANNMSDGNKAEKVEVVYDKDDSTKDWKYSSGIASNVDITGKGLSKYKALLCQPTLQGMYTVGELRLALDNNLNENKAVLSFRDDASNLWTFYIAYKKDADKLSYYVKYNNNTLSSGYPLIKIKGVY